MSTYKEETYHEPIDELGYLLECSDFAEQDKFINSIDFSMSKSKLNFTEKEATRQQSFDQIMNQISHTKREKQQLQKQLQAIKQDTVYTYLRNFHEQFKELNIVNQKLRAELNKCRKKISDDKSERLSNRSVIKPRTSVNSVIGDQNKKTSSKVNRNQVSPNMLLKKKQCKLTESTAHLGRSTIQSPKNHKRRESQLTERKMQENGSINISFIDDKSLDFNIRQSVSKRNLNCEEQKNIFVNLLQDLLIQQKISQSQRFGNFETQLMCNKVNNQKGKQEVKFINDMQNEIKETNEKLKILSLIMTKYQAQIQGINMNIRCVDDMNGKLLFVKGKYIQMEKKCEELSKLRKQVEVKQLSLQTKKICILQQDNEQERAIPSVETLLKIMTNNPKKVFNVKSVKLYSIYFKQVKELFKFDKQEQNKRYNRIVKVKQTIDNIREGRKKFNELIHIYESRIGKMEDKIKRIKILNQKEERK